MSAVHEYSIDGHNRSKVGLFIGLTSVTISSLCIDFVQFFLGYIGTLGYAVPTLILWPVTASFIFGVLFYLFNKYAWNIGFVRRIIGVPDLSGTWPLDGQSYNTEGTPTFAWQGSIEVTQNYDKILIQLKTSQSGSHSVSASILPEGSNFRLIYSYRNDPKPGEPELQAHCGNAEIVFAPCMKSAEGTYFNGHGRPTHGTMALTKEI